MSRVCLNLYSSFIHTVLKQTKQITKLELSICGYGMWNKADAKGIIIPSFLHVLLNGMLLMFPNPRIMQFCEFDFRSGKSRNRPVCRWGISWQINGWKSRSIVPRPMSLTPYWNLLKISEMKTISTLWKTIQYWILCYFLAQLAEKCNY